MTTGRNGMSLCHVSHSFILGCVCKTFGKTAPRIRAKLNQQVDTVTDDTPRSKQCCAEVLLIYKHTHACTCTRAHTHNYSHIHTSRAHTHRRTDTHYNGLFQMQLCGSVYLEHTRLFSQEVYLNLYQILSKHKHSQFSIRVVYGLQ